MNIENWELLIVSDGMHRAPDESRGVIRGLVYGHPVAYDGAEITTASILGWDFRDQCFVDVDGMEYRLKEPHPGYEQRFPNAKAKVEKAITKRCFMMSTADYMKRYKDGS